MIKLLKEYEESLDTLYNSLPLPIYNKIVATGIQGKLDKLKDYIEK